MASLTRRLMLAAALTVFQIPAGRFVPRPRTTRQILAP